MLQEGFAQAQYHEKRNDIRNEFCHALDEPSHNVLHSTFSEKMDKKKNPHHLIFDHILSPHLQFASFLNLIQLVQQALHLLNKSLPLEPRFLVAFRLHTV
jgi:hypothetical protein